MESGKRKLVATSLSFNGNHACLIFQCLSAIKSILLNKNKK
jgi:hypothetical protein